MKSTSRSSQPPRRHYEKPRLGRFSLKADEVLAKGCKTAAGAPNVVGFGCNFGGCVQAGS